jgi:hypothetical protein
MWPEFTDVDEFIQFWNVRNLLAIHISDAWRSRLGIVKYEDLIADPVVFDQACHFFGLPGVYLFRTDKSGGRQNLSDETQAKIDRGTFQVLAQLDQKRSFLAGGGAFSIRKVYRNTRFALIQSLRRIGILSH